jgi:hypothetical protein
MTERVLDNDYPVYPGYFYLADGVVVCSSLKGRVLDLKRDTGALEIRSCDAIGRGLLR